jgi:hypothetical protein
VEVNRYWTIIYARLNSSYNVKRFDLLDSNSGVKQTEMLNSSWETGFLFLEFNKHLLE